MVKTNPTANKVKVEKLCVAIAIWTIMSTRYRQRYNISHSLAQWTKTELWRHELAYETMFKNSIDVNIIYDTMDNCLSQCKLNNTTLTLTKVRFRYQNFSALRFRVYICVHVMHMVVGDFRFCFRPQCFVYSFFNFQFVQRLPLRHGLMMVWAKLSNGCKRTKLFCTLHGFHIKNNQSPEFRGFNSHKRGL